MLIDFLRLDWGIVRLPIRIIDQAMWGEYSQTYNMHIREEAYGSMAIVCFLIFGTYYLKFAFKTLRERHFPGSMEKPAAST